MYYKTKPRRKIFKPYLRNSEEYIEDSRIRRRHESTSRRMLKNKEETKRRRIKIDNFDEFTTTGYKLRRYKVDSKETSAGETRKLPKTSDKVVSRSKRRKLSGIEVPIINEEGEEDFGKLRYKEKYGEEFNRELNPREGIFHFLRLIRR